MNIEIYTDGACKNEAGRLNGNSGRFGRGGYCAKLIATNKDGTRYERHIICGAYRHTTSNRMEIMPVVHALSILKPGCDSIIIYSDSQYVVNTLKKGWIFRWEKFQFAGKKNPDLWRKFLKYYRMHKKVQLKWVRGHNGDKYNEFCDKMAKSARKWPPVLIDRYHEKKHLSRKRKRPRVITTT